MLPTWDSSRLLDAEVSLLPCWQGLHLPLAQQCSWGLQQTHRSFGPPQWSKIDEWNDNISQHMTTNKIHQNTTIRIRLELKKGSFWTAFRHSVHFHMSLSRCVTFVRLGHGLGHVLSAGLAIAQLARIEGLLNALGDRPWTSRFAI